MSKGRWPGLTGIFAGGKNMHVIKDIYAILVSDFLIYIYLTNLKKTKT